MQPDDNGNTTALAPVHSIGDDQLLAVADAAEKRIAAVNRIKGLALRVTNHQDWTNQGGKPYLQVSGAEKVARLFGISWRLDEPTREDHSDGHFSYTFKGYFSMGTAEIEVVGTRSSQDPFFAGSKDKPKPLSEIDRNDVKKGAMTNCIGNGISRLLGIRNLTWEEVESGGVNKERTNKVEYRNESADPNAAPNCPNYDLRDFPGCKGKPIDSPDVPVAALSTYLQGLEKSIADPSKSGYKTKNEALRDAIKEEIGRRHSGQTKAKTMKPEDFVASCYTRLNVCTNTDKLDELIDAIWSQAEELKLTQDHKDEIKTVYETKRAKLR